MPGTGIEPVRLFRDPGFQVEPFAGPFDNFAALSCSGQANEPAGEIPSAVEGSLSYGARDRNRTGTSLSGLGILSPVRLPVSPPGRCRPISEFYST